MRFGHGDVDDLVGGNEVHLAGFARLQIGGGGLAGRGGEEGLEETRARRGGGGLGDSTNCVKPGG